MDQAKIPVRAHLGECRVCDLRQRASGAVALVLVACALPGCARAQQPSFGPLTWEEGAPLQRISYTAMIERADLVPRGTMSADMWLGFSNIFEQDSSETHVLFLDMERLISTATVRWGVTDRLELGGRLTLETTGAGFLDSFVLWYHERLGFGQANRDRFPEDAYAHRLSDGETLLLDVPRRTLGLEDIRLFAKWLAASSQDGRSVLSLRVVARIPGESNRVGSESSDVALMALGRLGAGSWYVHGMLGASTVRASPELDPILRNASVFLTLGVERSLGSSVAGLFQYHVASPVLREFHHRELDWVASNVVFGVAGRWGDGWSWDVSFQEDIPADTPAVDFTLGMRLSRSWR